MKPISPANPDGDLMLEASSVGSDGDSEYVDTAVKFPMRLFITPELAGHIQELQLMHEVSEEDIDTIV